MTEKDEKRLLRCPRSFSLVFWNDWEKTVSGIVTTPLVGRGLKNSWSIHQHKTANKETVSVTSMYPQDGGSVCCCNNYYVDARLKNCMVCNQVSNVRRMSLRTRVSTWWPWKKGWRPLYQISPRSLVIYPFIVPGNINSKALTVWAFFHKTVRVVTFTATIKLVSRVGLP